MSRTGGGHATDVRKEDAASDLRRRRRQCLVRDEADGVSELERIPRMGPRCSEGAEAVVEIPEEPDNMEVLITCSYNYWNNERTIVYCI